MRSGNDDVGAIIVSMLYTQLLTAVVRWSEGGLECIIAGAYVLLWHGIICAVLELFAEVSCLIRPRDALACAQRI